MALLFLLLAARLRTIRYPNDLPILKTFGAIPEGHQLGADHCMVEIRIIYLVSTDAAKKLSSVEIDGKCVIKVGMSMFKGMWKLER